MTRLIVSRILQAVPTLWVIATLTFFMTRYAPGGPCDAERALPEEIKVKLKDISDWISLLDQYILYCRTSYGVTLDLV